MTAFFLPFAFFLYAADAEPEPFDLASAEPLVLEESGVACRIDTAPGAFGTRFAALAAADHALAGSYGLDIVKEGPGGRSSIRQGGEFALDGTAAALLGEATVTVESGTAVEAVLTLADFDGNTLCVAALPQRA